MLTTSSRREDRRKQKEENKTRCCGDHRKKKKGFTTDSRGGRDVPSSRLLDLGQAPAEKQGKQTHEALIGDVVVLQLLLSSSSLAMVDSHGSVQEWGKSFGNDVMVVKH
jgi:hypothetical protein